MIKIIAVWDSSYSREFIVTSFRVSKAPGGLLVTLDDGYNFVCNDIKVEAVK